MICFLLGSVHSNSVWFGADQKTTKTAAPRRLIFALCACLGVGACKPDEAKVRQYIPSQFSEAQIQESITFPFSCTSAVFTAVINKEKISGISGIKIGPIDKSAPDNSTLYRVFSNVERDCPLTTSENAGIRSLSEYLRAEDILFIEPMAGRLVIFDPARNLIVFLEG